MHGWLYHSEKPAGEIFADEAYTAKVKAGWVDSPALIHKKDPAGEPPHVHVPVELATEVRVKGKPGPKPKAWG